MDLVPRSCIMAKLLTTSRDSDFRQNEHVFSRLTVLVTVSKGSPKVSACNEMPSRRL